jgi:hypothetical protein
LIKYGYLSFKKIIQVVLKYLFALLSNTYALGDEIFGIKWELEKVIETHQMAKAARTRTDLGRGKGEQG